MKAIGCCSLFIIALAACGGPSRPNVAAPTELYSKVDLTSMSTCSATSMCPMLNSDCVIVGTGPAYCFVHGQEGNSIGCTQGGQLIISSSYPAVASCQ